MDEYAAQISNECLRLLIEIRLKRGISHQKLADATRLSRAYIGLLEKGARRPTLEVVIKLATALGVKFSKIVSQAEKSVKQAQE